MRQKSLPEKEPATQVVKNRGGPALRDSSAAWLRWILGSITPPISPRLPA
jgi:hypothetical protein